MSSKDLHMCCKLYFFLFSKNEPPRAARSPCSRVEWKRQKRFPQWQIVIEESRGHEILDAWYSDMHPLRNCLLVQWQKQSAYFVPTSESTNLNRKKQIASERNWIRRSQRGSGATHQRSNLRNLHENEGFSWSICSTRRTYRRSRASPERIADGGWTAGPLRKLFSLHPLAGFLLSCGFSRIIISFLFRRFYFLELRSYLEKNCQARGFHVVFWCARV